MFVFVKYRQGRVEQVETAASIVEDEDGGVTVTTCTGVLIEFDGLDVEKLEVTF